MPTQHAAYSPSGLGDKMKCLGRHMATLGIESESSSYAERGTECHDWADKLLPAVLDGQESIDVPDFVESWQEDCTKAMVGHAVKVYEAMLMNSEGDVDVYTEEEVKLSHYRNDLKEFDLSQVWGTCDVIMYCRDSGELTVLDYKTGQGVAVHPTNNTQLSVYALGAIGLIQDIYDDPRFGKINICISQPRIMEDVQIWETDQSELDLWLRTDLIPALVEMSKPNAPFTPGESQCRWCPIKGKCKAQRDEMLQLFDDHQPAAGNESPTLSDEEVNALMLRLSEFKKWTGQIESAAMDIMSDGRSLPDFKLIRGKSNRVWKDMEAAEKFLVGQRLKQDERYTRKLISPAQAEKKLKENLKRTKTFNNFNNIVEKPQGKISWAKKDDPREEVVINKTEALVSIEDLL